MRNGTRRKCTCSITSANSNKGTKPKETTNLQSKGRHQIVLKEFGNASSVVSKKKHVKPTDCPVSRICKKMNHFVKLCMSDKVKGHLAEETEESDSEESLLKIEEEITAIKGGGTQLTSKITFIREGKYEEQGNWCDLQRHSSQ